MDNLTFQEEGHIYKLGNRRLLSVSQALAILDDRWKVDPFYLERGRIIHLCTALYDWDELDDSTVDERVKPYFDAYVKFKADTHIVISLTEHRLFHPTYYYAGTPDKTGFLNDELSLIDIKSGAKSTIDSLQLAAYWELCRVNNIPVKKQFDLYLRDNGTYKLEPVENRKLLLRVFLAALTCARFKEGL